MTSSSSASVLRRVGGLAVAAGSLFTAAGVGAWITVTKQLREEKIVVPGNAPVLAGEPVQDPATAYVEALVIKNNAERGAEGRTFADISEALRKVESGSDEERKLRGQSASLSTAAALRTSLMKPVLAYGVSAFAAGVGVFLAVVGTQLRREPSPHRRSVVAVRRGAVRNRRRPGLGLGERGRGDRRHDHRLSRQCQQERPRTGVGALLPVFPAQAHRCEHGRDPVQADEREARGQPDGSGEEHEDRGETEHGAHADRGSWGEDPAGAHDEHPPHHLERGRREQGRGHPRIRSRGHGSQDEARPDGRESGPELADHHTAGDAVRRALSAPMLTPSRMSALPRWRMWSAVFSARMFAPVSAMKKPTMPSSR